ncbi:Methyltransferase FkbM domain-containing protein [Caenorhabditis elegans]|uniref:Methyltransferase FkbM domain-containing protein n=1 Tax=Caenorhabditis elegans TaxID=6239 RepID=Q95YC0_CAEEL|nr:Methyltransferase FkbM domain-containing protein [Caenorhabditis elegans]CCD70083.2 Methyltransferase FkbM domain-containing protein [Caenorhabditis elegans]|eukprot:NP_493824.2 Uncharacterized protein CELE_F28A10.1 [Caenorhabditis elegans]
MNMLFKYLLLTAGCFAIFVLLYKTEPVDDNVTKSSRTLIQPKSSKIQLKSFKPTFFEEWNSCVAQKFLAIPMTAEDFWGSFEKKSRACDHDTNVTQHLRAIPLQNSDEVKYAILPVRKTPNDVFVTLGIGQDINAEVKFQKEMQNIGLNVSFYGADPIVEGNSVLYSTIGKYFPFAVGEKAGFSTASVLLDERYINMPVVHVDIYYFLKDILDKNVIDYFWMDSEYAEYGTFDIFYENGKLEQLGITFCQMSLEVHSPSKEQKEQFMIFIKRVVEEKWFGFFFTEQVSHIRMWIFNFGSEYCVHKFLN